MDPIQTILARIHALFQPAPPAPSITSPQTGGGLTGGVQQAQSPQIPQAPTSTVGDSVKGQGSAAVMKIISSIFGG